MNNFTFYSPTKFVFGKGVTDSVGQTLAAEGFTSVLLVYGQGSVVKCGTLDRVKKSLEAAGIAYCELGGVRPNPEVNSLRKGIAIARENQVNLILAIGGGSAMDCAKGIGVGFDYEGDVWDFSCKKAPITHTLPVASVVTIPASGSEASDSCVISNDELHLKSGMNSDIIRPFMAFLDPELTFTLPPYQTAAGVTDIIAHILERYFSGVGAVPVTDNIAAGLIRAVMENGTKVMEEPENYEARANIMWAGTLAHNGIAGCGRGIGGRVGDWSSHGLEHELSSLDPAITHGAGLACLLYTSDAADESEAAQVEAAKAGIEALQDYFASLGMPRTLAEFGIHEEDIEKMVPTLLQNKGEAFGAFKKITIEDACEIYRSAL